MHPAFRPGETVRGLVHPDYAFIRGRNNRRHGNVRDNRHVPDTGNAGNRHACGFRDWRHVLFGRGRHFGTACNNNSAVNPVI